MDSVNLGITLHACGTFMEAAQQGGAATFITAQSSQHNVVSGVQNLCRVQGVEAAIELVSGVDGLDVQVPLREAAGLDGFVQILAGEGAVGALRCHCAYVLVQQAFLACVNYCKGLNWYQRKS